MKPCKPNSPNRLGVFAIRPPDLPFTSECPPGRVCNKTSRPPIHLRVSAWACLQQDLPTSHSPQSVRLGVFATRPPDLPFTSECPPGRVCNKTSRPPIHLRVSAWACLQQDLPTSHSPQSVRLGVFATRPPDLPFTSECICSTEDYIVSAQVEGLHCQTYSVPLSQHLLKSV